MPMRCRIFPAILIAVECKFYIFWAEWADKSVALSCAVDVNDLSVELRPLFLALMLDGKHFFIFFMLPFLNSCPEFVCGAVVSRLPLWCAYRVRTDGRTLRHEL